MNKKAFTIVEVLAVVVLLGVLATISIPIIQNYINENKKTFNKQLEKQLLLAGKEYFSENKNLLPRISYLDKYQDGESKNYVLAIELLAQNYIKNDFVDADKNDCSDSYVIVTKNSNLEDYDWHACLICGKDENKKVLTTKDSYCSLEANLDDKEKPSCEGKINVISGNDNNKKIYNNENIELFISPTDNAISEDNKNYSSIVIHNETTNTVYVKDISKEKEENIKRIDIAPYLKTDGNYSVSIMDKGYNKSNACISDFVIDNTNPKCTISGNPSDWVQNANLVVSGNDENGLDEFPFSWTSNASGFGTVATKTITSNGIYTAYIKDIVGNIGSCHVDVNKIDTSKPSITVSNSQTAWTKNNVTVSASASDGTSGSGIDRIEYSTDNKTWSTLETAASGSKTYDSTTDITFYARAIDKVGLISDVKSTTVKVDKTPPNAPKVNSFYFSDVVSYKTNCIGKGGTQSNVSCNVCLHVSSINWSFSANRTYTDTGGSGLNRDKDQFKWTHTGSKPQYTSWTYEATAESNGFKWLVGPSSAAYTVTYAQRLIDNVGNVGYYTSITYRGNTTNTSYNNCVSNYIG